MFQTALKALPNRIQLLFWILLVSCISLIPRLHSGLDIPNYLWAEDGTIFFNQAIQFGVKSIFHEYAGYLHLYPRIIAWITSLLPLNYLPYIYFLGWFLAFLISMLVIVNTLKEAEIDLVSALYFIALIVLQPNDSEVFFSLTNSQWFIGLALMIIIAVKETFKLTVINMLISVVAVLTGPFSILAFGAAACRALFDKKLKENLWFYLVLTFGTLMQVLYILNSDRGDKYSSLNLDFIEWVKAFVDVFLYGANGVLVVIMALLFWVVVLHLIYKSVKASGSVNKHKVYILMFIVILLNVLAVFYAFKNPYVVMGMAKSGGGRYTLIPYSMMFLMAIYAAKSHLNARFFVLILATLISLVQFKQANRDDLFFRSYMNFSKYTDTIIPINPVYARASSPHFNVTVKEKEISKLTRINVDFIVPHIANNKVQYTANKLLECGRAKHVAVELKSNANVFNSVSIYLSNNEHFKRSKTIKRYYLGQGELIHFIFPYNQSSQYLGITDLSGKIAHANVYCIP